MKILIAFILLTSISWAQENPAHTAGNVPETSAPTSADSSDKLQNVSPAPVTETEQTERQSTFWTIINAGGTIGLLLFGLSIAALTLAIDLLRTLRKSVFIPDGLANDVRELITKGQLLQADKRCRETPCCLTYVINAGLAESDGDWTDIEKTLEDSLAEQSAQCMRKIEYLSVIGNIAPMLGLLGTVVGMVYAFSELANSQGTPKPAELAQGIYLALVTTVEGLIVAIPALAAFAYFRGRVDKLMTDVVFQVQYAFLPLKRQIRAGRRSVSLQAPPKNG